MNIFKQLQKYSWLIKALLKTDLKTKKELLKSYRQRKKYYFKDDFNADLKKLVYCMNCPNMCRFDCPVVETSKNESHSPATKARIAYFLELDVLEKTPENLMPIFEGCLHCYACQMWCPFDFSVGELLEDVYSDLLAEQAIPDEISEFVERIHVNEGLYPEEKYRITESMREKLHSGSTYFFSGCVTKTNYPQVIKNVIKISEKIENPMQTNFEEQKCCGAPAIYSGDFEEARKLAKTNIEMFKANGIKEIVCECPECAYTLKNLYREKLGLAFEIPVYHIIEWLYKKIEKKDISIRSKSEKGNPYTPFPVSYHDPCILVRKLNVIREPYFFLKKLFGKNFNEINYSRFDTNCCGYGGVVNIVNPDLASNISKKRLKEFLDKGIKTIVTTCPTCHYSFMKNNIEMEFEIVDLIELLGESIYLKK
ncbi:MAG: (Fe-S)-binding protein [Asgard group archaeon]|nr:(Fe-S)-binding protein [Asgard group archaeon]